SWPAIPRATTPTPTSPLAQGPKIPAVTAATAPAKSPTTHSPGATSDAIKLTLGDLSETHSNARNATRRQQLNFQQRLLPVTATTEAVKPLRDLNHWLRDQRRIPVHERQHYRAECYHPSTNHPIGAGTQDR
ncbi:hypothetical protein MTO96_042266, partial [Rhipicephalus appendiculatus]